VVSVSILRYSLVDGFDSRYFDRNAGFT